MKKLVLSAFALSVLFTACKKDDDKNGVSSRKDALVGTWKMTGYGLDVNNNGKVDQGEVADPSLAEMSASIKFNTDGTGVTMSSFSGFEDTSDIKWALINNDNTLRIINDWDSAEDADTTDTDFVSFENSKFIIKDETTTPPSFGEFTKQ